jgi:ubiquinone biosynthesis protein
MGLARRWPVPRLAELDRLRRITQVLVRHGILGLVDRWLTSGGGDREVADARLGRRLRAALAELGPTFVKLGQVLATREDLVPRAMAEELAQLEREARPFSVAVARHRIERALGRSIEQAFSHFDDTPLAAGSIAQIHRATTLAGQAVVIKVRRPGIRRLVEDDLALLSTLAGHAAQRWPALGRHDPVGFVTELGRGLRRELDLGAEAEALGAMAQALGPSVLVPKPVAELSTPDVLTMEYVAGTGVRALAGPAAQRGAARRIATAFAAQYLGADLFHADPHAGNLLIDERGRLVLLDLGAIGQLGPAVRRDLIALAAAGATGRGELMARALLGMVHVPPGFDRRAYEQSLGPLLVTMIGRPLGGVRIGDAIREVFGLAQRHGLRFRAEHFALMRSALLVDGVLRMLDPELDPVRAVRGHILRSFWRPRWVRPAAALAWATLRGAGSRLVSGLARAWNGPGRRWLWATRRRFASWSRAVTWTVARAVARARGLGRGSTPEAPAPIAAPRVARRASTLTVLVVVASALTSSPRRGLVAAPRLHQVDDGAHALALGRGEDGLGQGHVLDGQAR